MNKIKFKYYVNEKEKIFRWRYSEKLELMKKDSLNSNFANFNCIVPMDNVNKNFVSIFSNYKTDSCCSITYKQYVILGENVEALSSYKLVYHPPFTMVKYDFIRCVWTSLQAEEESKNVLDTKY